MLTAEVHALADMPAALVWLANIDNPNTRRTYQADGEGSTAFIGLEHSDEFRLELVFW